MNVCQRGPCRTTRCCRVEAQVEYAPFISFTLPELLELTDQDLDELDAIAGDEDRVRTWWRARRWGWAMQDQEVAE